VWEILHENVFKILITDLDKLKQRLRMDHVALRQPFVSGIVDRSRSAMRVLYTFFRNIPTRVNQLNSYLVNLEATVKVRKILELL